MWRLVCAIFSRLHFHGVVTMIDKISSLQPGEKRRRNDGIMELWVRNIPSEEICAMTGIGKQKLMTIVRDCRRHGDARAVPRRRGPTPFDADRFCSLKETAAAALALADRVLEFFEDAIDPEATDDLATAAHAFRAQLREIARHAPLARG